MLDRRLGDLDLGGSVVGILGIGLWVANQLVGAMGGGITVSSRLGEGSTFTVTLPLTPADPDRTTHDAA